MRKVRIIINFTDTQDNDYVAVFVTRSLQESACSFIG